MADISERPARPWDLFNKNLGRVQGEIAEQRMATCRACEHFLITQQCSQCGCIMLAKTRLPNAFCPVGKWDAERVSYKEEHHG